MTTIKIFVYDNLIGVAQSISIKEYPPSTTGVVGQKLWISRMRLDQSKLEKLFIQNQVHVAAQQYPMQIIIEEDKKEILKIHNAWISGMGHSFTSTDWVVVEDIHLEAEFISGEFTSVEKISDITS